MVNKKTPPDCGYKPLPGETRTALCMLRTEIMDLKKVLETVKDGQASLNFYADYIEKTRKDISKLMTNLPESEYADSIRHLRNIWEQMQLNPIIVKPTDPLEAQKQTCQMNILDIQFKEMIFEIGYLTIPSSLQDWLQAAKPGYYIPFHDVFEDEMPDLADRVKFLNFLVYSPESVPNGMVNAENGFIYRYSPDKKERRKSLGIAVLCMLAATGIVAAFAYLPIGGWPLKQNNLAALLIGWVALIVGVIIHIAIAIAKRQKTEKGNPPIIAISNFMLLIDAKIGQILLKILLMLVGFSGLVFAAGIDNAKPLNAFLVGYSLDSFVELFGASIEQKATALLATSKQQLGITK